METKDAKLEKEGAVKMREALEIFFQKNNESWKKLWGTLPKVPINEKYGQCILYVSSPDEDNEVEWQPKLQTEAIDFEFIEKEIGFKIHPQIKAYLSTYWFMSLEGKTDIVNHVVLHKVLPQSQLELMRDIKHYFDKNTFHYLNDGEYFLISEFCCIDKNDSYVVHVNNDTGEVTAVQNFDKKSIKIADSIEELLMNMRGIWDR